MAYVFDRRMWLLGFSAGGVEITSDQPSPPQGFETFLDEFGIPFRDEFGDYIYTPI